MANASSRGWGAPCSGRVVTVTRADGLKLPVRTEIAELISLLCAETERLGYHLRPGWCWGYACRKIRGSSSWSNHAWAIAVDLNAPENPMGPRNGKIRKYPAVIAVWKRFGFRWGGDYSGRADDMHFEFMGTPADAKRVTERARKELGTAPAQEDAAVFYIKAGKLYQVVTIPDKGGKSVLVGRGKYGTARKKALEGVGVKIYVGKDADALAAAFPQPEKAA